MAKRKKFNPERDLKNIGRVLARVARAADRNMPGIDCAKVERGGEHGEEFQIVGIGKIFFGNQGVVILGSCGGGIDLSQVPGIDLVAKALIGYAKRKEDEKQAVQQQAKDYVLHREVELLRSWHPRVLIEYQRQQEERAAAERAQQREDDGSDEYGY